MLADRQEIVQSYCNEYGGAIDSQVFPLKDSLQSFLINEAMTSRGAELTCPITLISPLIFPHFIQNEHKFHIAAHWGKSIVFQKIEIRPPPPDVYSPPFLGCRSQVCKTLGGKAALYWGASLGILRVTPPSLETFEFLVSWGKVSEGSIRWSC